jgi:hypothetical protein
MFIGYIYKITGACGKVYIGSTVNLTRRIQIHNHSNNRCNSKFLEKPLKLEIIRQDEYKLNKTMRLVEQFYIDNIDCVNIQRAYYGYTGAKLMLEKKKKRAKKYYETHKEEKKEDAKKYYETHKEEKREYVKKYSETHKEEKREYNKNYRETHKEERKGYDKKYRKTHKKELNEKAKKYRETHKDEIKEYDKYYRETHKEELNKKIECKYCKALISKKSMSKHLKKTKRCLAIQKSLEF